MFNAIRLNLIMVVFLMFGIFDTVYAVSVDEVPVISLYPTSPLDELRSSIKRSKTIITFYDLNEFSTDAIDIIGRKLLLDSEGIRSIHKASIYKHGRSHIFMSGTNSEELVRRILRHWYSDQRKLISEIAVETTISTESNSASSLSELRKILFLLLPALVIINSH